MLNEANYGADQGQHVYRFKRNRNDKCGNNFTSCCDISIPDIVTQSTFPFQFSYYQIESLIYIYMVGILDCYIASSLLLHMFIVLL